MSKAPPAEWKGLTVPFITMWRNEGVQAVRPEPLLGGRLAIFPEAPAPLGSPDLSAVDHSRQRIAVLERRCQVCARPLGRWRWAAALGRECDHGDGILRYEPPACRPCAALAARICPALKRKRPTWQAVEREGVVLQMLKPHTLRRDGHKVPAWCGPVVGLAEYVVLAVREWHLHDEFLRLTEGDFDAAAAGRADAVLLSRSPA